MADFQLLADDGVSAAALDFGQVYEGIPTSWRAVILKNVSGETITSIVVESSDYAIQFQDTVGGLSSGYDGIVPTETGQAAGTITNTGTTSFQIALEPIQGNQGPQTFALTVSGMRGSSPANLTINGSYTVASLPAQALAWSINVVQPSYPRPHYDEDWTPNEDGSYFEDPDNPGILVLDLFDGSGNYPNIADVLSDVGIEFS